MANSDINALESMDYAIRYNSYILKKILENLSEGNILDFGAGFGTFSKLLMISGKEVTALEIDSEAISKLKKDNINNISSLNNKSESYQNIVSINVLEHIDDDEEILRLLFQALKPSGKLILYLPASMLVWSYIDVWVNHRRRYMKKDLKLKVENAGFHVLNIEYVDFTGWIGVLFMKILHYKPALNESKIKFYDKFIFNPFKFIDLIFKRIIGKNIFLVAEKKSQ